MEWMFLIVGVVFLYVVYEIDNHPTKENKE
jgi:hypothetical protein